MKRCLVFVVCLAVLVTTVITGCGGAEQKNTGEIKKDEPAVARVQTEPVRIIQDEVSADGADASDNAKVKAYIEEKSGVKFEITQTKSAQDLMTKINLMVASHENIDILRISSKEFLWDLQSRGALMKLNTVIEKNVPEIISHFPEDVWKSVTDKNGDIWGVPRAQDNNGNMPYIRKDWREKLGIKNPPTTLDEFENYLKAVKNTDFDGNGVNDAIPLLTYRGISELDWAFLYSFCEVSGDYTGNYIDSSGKITPTILHPQYKDFIKKMSEWYKNGLLFQEIYNIKRERANDLTVANRVAAGAGWYSDPVRPWETLMKKVPDAHYEFLSLKTLKGNPHKVSRNPVGNPGVSIVSYSKNADFALKLIDWTVASATNYVTTRQGGVPGLHWTWANESKLEINDSKEVGKNIYNAAYGITTNNRYNTVKIVNKDPGFVNSKYLEVQMLMSQIGYVFSPDWFVSYQWKGTPVESSLSDAATMIDEAKTQIIIGQKPLEDWDKVIAQYRKMHGDKYIELATKYYNEYKKK